MLGVAGVDLITSFVHDAGASTSRVEYRNTQWLVDEVARLEAGSPNRFKGIIHSHPSGMARPSGQDQREFAESLQLNPHLGRYLGPIVTQDVRRPPAEHELIYEQSRVSFYGAAFAGKQLLLMPMRPRVLPIGRSLARIGSAGHAPALVEVDGVPLLGSTCDLPGLGSVLLFFGVDFPASPPLLVAEGRQPVALPWSLDDPPDERLARAVAALSRLEDGQRPEHRTESRSMGIRPAPDGKRPSDFLFARSAGLLSRSLQCRRVLLVGAGSVGSYLAEGMVRSGVGGVTLVDPDHVAAENIGRSPFLLDDVGSLKVGAVERRLRAINASVEVSSYARTVQDIDAQELTDLIQGADLVVAATDDNNAQQRLNLFSYWNGKPAVFIGLYKGAAGGEVIMSMPGSPCWQCSTAGVREATDEVQRSSDYGTGRLVAEPGLLADIHHVCSAALKMILGVIEDDVNSAVRRLLVDPVAQGRVYVAFGMAPHYWIFPEAMSLAFAQHAFQSIWMTTESRDACPVCGEADHRTDPLAVRIPPKDIQGILRHVEEQWSQKRRRRPERGPTDDPDGGPE